jgi:hypothetical protein
MYVHLDVDSLEVNILTVGNLEVDNMTWHLTYMYVGKYLSQ